MERPLTDGMNWKRGKCTEADICWRSLVWKGCWTQQHFSVCEVPGEGMWDQPLQTQSAKHSVIFWALKGQVGDEDTQCLSESPNEAGRVTQGW